MEGGARSLARGCIHALLDFFLPRACVSCNAALDPADHALVCTVCLGRIPALPAPQCDRCGHPLLRGKCQWCTLLPPYVRSARSVCWMPGGVAGDLVHRLKYDGWKRLAEPMAERMARLSFPEDVVEERSLLVPVPLARDRMRERGYNQSAVLADSLGESWCLPVACALERRRSTQSQTRLTPRDRLHNVAGAFGTVVGKEELAGRHVVLVDDVVTTAATLNACAAALHLGGARIISYVTFGRARAAGDAP